MENVMNIEKINKSCREKIKELCTYAKTHDNIQKVVVFGKAVDPRIGDEFIDIAVAVDVKDLDQSEVDAIELDIMNHTHDVIPFLVGADNVNQERLDYYISAGVIIYDNNL